MVKSGAVCQVFLTKRGLFGVFFRWKNTFFECFLMKNEAKMQFFEAFLRLKLAFFGYFSDKIVSEIV
jgi:hypothetical protein